MKMSQGALSATLLEIAAAVQAGDSFEGQINYSCMEEELGLDEYEVTGGYRIGNKDGQGGMQLLGKTTETKNPAGGDATMLADQIVQRQIYRKLGTEIEGCEECKRKWAHGMPEKHAAYCLVGLYREARRKERT